jgi:virulence-associated protein VagC
MRVRVPNQRNDDLQQRASTTSLVCHKCGRLPRERQYFCTDCGTSLTHQVDTNNMQNIHSLPQTSVDSRKRSSAISLPGEISLPTTSASLYGKEEQRTPSPQRPRSESSDSIVDQDDLTAQWAASVRMDTSGLPPHLTQLQSEETMPWKQDLRNCERGSLATVRAFVQQWKLRKGECYLVAASVMIGAVLTWVVWK